jgi:hypothetical protein
MPVIFNTLKNGPNASAPTKSNRRHGFDKAVKALAPRLEVLQASGVRGIREIATALNDLGLKAPNGGTFTYGTTRRVLQRLVELELGLGPRTLSGAASKRPYKSRPRPSRCASPIKTVARHIATFEGK